MKKRITVPPCEGCRKLSAKVLLLEAELKGFRADRIVATPVGSSRLTNGRAKTGLVTDKHKFRMSG